MASELRPPAHADYLPLVNKVDNVPLDFDFDTLYKLLLPNDPRPQGFILPATVARLPWTADFRIDHDERVVRLADITSTDGPDPGRAATAALQRVVDGAIALGDAFPSVNGRHSEPFRVLGANHPVSIERFPAPLFGISSRGAHMTAYVKTADGLKIWVPRRSAHLFTYPDLLDTTVAGGVKADDSPLDCILAEASEEASLPAAFVRDNARAVGAVTYVSMNEAKGTFFPTVLYCYDLELPESIVPTPGDDEVSAFELMSIDQVKAAMLGEQFKPNCVLVMLDFFIRHNVVTAENEERASAKPSGASKASKAKAAPKRKRAASDTEQTDSEQEVTVKKKAKTGFNSKYWTEFGTEVFDNKQAKRKIFETLNVEVPPLAPGEIDRILPKELADTDYDQHWTEQDEQDLREKWHSNGLRVDLIKTKDTKIPKLFKVVLRFFRMSPHDLISERFALQYAANRRDRQPQWSTAFTQPLYELVPHPLWCGNHLLLVAAIQYAVILRTGDYRTWRLIQPNDPNGDSFFQTFSEVLRDWKGRNKSIKAHHKEVITRMTQKSSLPFFTRPVFSAFLDALEKCVKPDRRVRDITEADGPVIAYPVESCDLNAVAKALDSTKHFGAIHFMPTSHYSLQILGSRSLPEDDPPKRSELPEYLDRAELSSRRHSARAQKRRERIQEGKEDEAVAGASSHREQEQQDEPSTPSE
ncbi:Uncharacterized protein CTRI78_v002101 [Colletotrichum trifolii]|uniref:Nudix hydrolase domain-containing protein n=1 Tax=Colletotrichum trifolii TaxID=5466 RepID=A0A4R8RMR8_COLTR|nr:Uncharacterized protein CTRI78_v002101 [Colletotrichum trifolii]